MSALIAVAPASSPLAAPPARRRASPRPPARPARLRGLRRFSPPRSAALGTNPEPMGAGAAIPADENDLPAMRQACLRVATDAAKRGATIMLEKLGADVVKTKANARDLLTEVDPEVQRIIEGSVSEAFPTHRFLGEESVPPGAEASDAALAELLDDGGDEEGSEGGSDWLWVVDPIDGTTNFCHSMPLSAISIGVAYRGELQVAVIMDPFAGEIFSASKGCGAYCNFAQMRVGEEATGEESVVVTGYGATAESADAMIKGMKALTALPVRSIRMLGSAAIMLAWVAAGRLTAYYECDLNSWDTAAGALLVREAGGEMTDLVTGEAYSLRTRAILASNGKTHEEIRTCLIEGGVRALKDYEESKEYEESRG